MTNMQKNFSTDYWCNVGVLSWMLPGCSDNLECTVEVRQKTSWRKRWSSVAVPSFHALMCLLIWLH